MTDNQETIHDLQDALLETVGSLALLSLDKAPGVPEIIENIKKALEKSGRYGPQGE